MSNVDTIVEFLESVGRGCCDDCISRETGVKPRQQVNQICRRLEEQGKIVREEGRCALGDHRKKLSIVADALRHTPVAPAAAAQSVELPSSRQKGPPVAIEHLYNQLDRFCKAVWAKHESTTAPDTLNALISTLSKHGIVPRHQANMMHTIRKLRNLYVHEHVGIGTKETVMVQAAWDIIREWAESHESELWRLATRSS